MNDFSWLQQSVKPLSEAARDAALARQEQLTKPPGSLGKLEAIAVQLASLQGTDRPQMERVQISIFAADHGVAAEGVSAFPQAVTAEMVRNFARGGAAGARGEPQKETQSAEARRTVTFNRDVAPILFHSCASCHHPGEAGPFPLLTYGDAKSHARQIARVTRARIMPPWLPEPGEFKFADELRLSDQQIQLIEEWVKDGAVEGEAADLPP